MRTDRIHVPRMRGFRNFLLRGNVVDLAVGIVVGAAFTSVVNGFVRAFLTPVVGVAVGASGDFSNDGFRIAGVLFPYGASLTAVVTFILVAAAVYYFVVLPVNRDDGPFQARHRPGHTETRLPGMSELHPRRRPPLRLLHLATGARLTGARRLAGRAVRGPHGRPEVSCRPRTRRSGRRRRCPVRGSAR